MGTVIISVAQKALRSAACALVHSPAWRLRTSVLAPCCLIVLVGAGEVAAQGRPEDEFRGITVLNRERPEYDPLGLRIGAFTVRGRATLDQGYNDNVFYTANNKKGDNVTLARADGSFSSNWSRHAVGGFAGVQRLQYYSLRDQSYTNVEGGLNGAYDVTPDTRLAGDVFTNVSHVIRTDSDAVPSDEPIQFRTTGGGVGVTQQLARYRLGLRGFYRTVDYDAYAFNGVTVRGSGQFNDVNIYGATGTVGYVLGPYRTVLAGVRVARFDYTSVPTGFLDLSSQSINGFVGFNYDFDGVWRYEIDLGYIYQQYDEDRIASLSGPSGAIRVTWAPTALLAITANASRNIGQQLVSVPGVRNIDNGFFSNRLNLTGTYELFRNVLVNAGVTLRYDEFQGTRGTALFLEETIGFNVLLDRNFRVGGFYLRQDTLNENGGDPSRNVIALRLTAAL
ncbi:outer membrane beta-barrel protein [Elioraea sp.]|uniref:outer membrane beta-barrel protein n=1 Tax=Elioraea sp. TaxID=2185103 RepID=UPI0025BB8A77|nr:outer membrane beta-barrel protein [Elioraea sp.]